MARGRSTICLTFNKQKMADLGLHFGRRGEGEDEETVLEMELGSEPLLHEDFKKHVLTELGTRAHDELADVILTAYAGIALKHTLS